MENLSDAEKNVEKDRENVIEMQIYKDECLVDKSIPYDVMFPASKNYAETYDNPVDDLLSEFDFLVSEESSSENTRHEAYFLKLRENENFKISYLESLKSMISKINLQVKRIKEDTSRMKYYLDEID